MTQRYQTPFSAIVAGIRDLFLKQDRAGSIALTDRLDGKRVLIDGSSSGLGFAIAVQLARLGAHIVMAVRSGIPGKGEEVKRMSGNPNVDMLPVDFSDIGSIYDLVGKVKERFGQVDIVISNAAMVSSKARKTPQGLDQMFMVNYLSKFIYLNDLLNKDCLRMNGKEVPRIIITASESHRNPKSFAWEEFGVFRDYSMKETVAHYGYTKLLLVTFVNELSRRLNPDGNLRIAVSSFCPGPVNSNIAREAPALFKPFLKFVFRLVFRSPEKAAETAVFLASSSQTGNRPMDYLFLMSRVPMDEKATDPVNGKKLWEMSSELVNKLGKPEGRK